MVEKIVIPDEEWKKFLEEEYKQVAFGHPKKDATEKYLNWKAKQQD